MSPVMTFRIAFKALGRNKMRTALTMLGMIIGVSAVITLVAMGNGATSMIEDQIKGAGTNMITVNAGNFSQGGVRGGSGTSSTLTPEDADAIRKEVDGIPERSGLARGPGQKRRRRPDHRQHCQSAAGADGVFGGKIAAVATLIFRAQTGLIVKARTGMVRAKTGKPRES